MKKIIFEINDDLATLVKYYSDVIGIPQTHFIQKLIYLYASDRHEQLSKDPESIFYGLKNSHHENSVPSLALKNFRKVSEWIADASDRGEAPTRGPKPYNPYLE